MKYKNNDIIHKLQVCKMNSIDKVTLELLMNRSLWSKNTDQQDIYKTEEQNELKRKIQQYKVRILQIMNQYLENPDFHENNEMDEIFEIYVKKNISYFEMNDLAIERFCSNNEDSGYETECDNKEDILFDTTEMNSEFADTNFSCWSNDRVRRLPAKYTMDMYVERK